MTYAITAATLEEFLDKLEDSGLLEKLAAHNPKLFVSYAMKHLRFFAGIYPDKDYDVEDLILHRDSIEPTMLARQDGFMLSLTLPIDELQARMKKWRAIAASTVTFDMGIDDERDDSGTA